MASGNEGWSNGSSLLAAALAYAKAGFLVYPIYETRSGVCSCREHSKCRTPGKHPRTIHGINDANADTETIKQWWKKWPMANIGIATGSSSRIVVLDVDPRHGGEASLTALIAQLGPLSATAEAKTGGGGRHLVFRHPGGHVKNPVGVRPGIDIRGDGLGIVAPPSIHASGGKYGWSDGRGLLDHQIAELPTKWLDWLQQEGVTQRNGELEKPTKKRTGETEAICSSSTFSALTQRHTDTEIASASLPLCVKHEWVDLNELSEDERAQVKTAIARSIPSVPGTRNQRALFGLTRRLQGIPKLAGADPRSLRPIVAAWYDRAMGKMSGEHDLEGCWTEFLFGWPRVRCPGELDLVLIARQVLAGPAHPACDVLALKKPHMRLLIGLCAKLQDLRGDAPFFLGSHKAAEVLTAAVGKPVTNKTCFTYLGALVAAEVLQLVRKGDEHHANRYRFVWQPGQATAAKPPHWLTNGACSEMTK